MERIDERIKKSGGTNGCMPTCPLIRPKMRAYSHEGHGPRADQTGRIHISDFRFPRTISLAKRSRSIHSCQFQTFLNELAKSLSRKLDVIEVMTTALTELIDAQREIRVEALIVLLIAVEIVIWLYEFFERG